MNNSIIDNRELLIELCKKKLKLLNSVSEHYEHIVSNSVFIEEIQESYLEFDQLESDLISEKATTIECTSCGFECDQIHSYCLACGTKLHEQFGTTTAQKHWAQYDH